MLLSGKGLYRLKGGLGVNLGSCDWRQHLYKENMTSVSTQGKPTRCFSFQSKRSAESSGTIPRKDELFIIAHLTIFQEINWTGVLYGAYSFLDCQFKLKVFQIRQQNFSWPHSVSLWHGQIFLVSRLPRSDFWGIVLELSQWTTRLISPQQTLELAMQKCL